MLYLEASTVKTTLGCPGCRVGHVTGLCYVGLCLYGFCPFSLSLCCLCLAFWLAAPWLVREWRGRVSGFGRSSCRCDFGLKLLGLSLGAVRAHSFMCVGSQLCCDMFSQSFACGMFCGGNCHCCLLFVLASRQNFVFMAKAVARGVAAFYTPLYLGFTAYNRPWNWFSFAVGVGFGACSALLWIVWVLWPN